MPRLKPYVAAQKFYRETLKQIASRPSRYTAQLQALYAHADYWGIPHPPLTETVYRTTKPPELRVTPVALTQERVSQPTSKVPPRRPGL